jgi:hypothetical protein
MFIHASILMSIRPAANTDWPVYFACECLHTSILIKHSSNFLTTSRILHVLVYILGSNNTCNVTCNLHVHCAPSRWHCMIRVRVGVSICADGFAKSASLNASCLLLGLYSEKQIILQYPLGHNCQGILSCLERCIPRSMPIVPPWI